MCGQDCWSALISAAKEGHVDVVKELLENSAYVEHRDMVRHTHTHTRACLQAHIKGIKAD